MHVCVCRSETRKGIVERVEEILGTVERVMRYIYYKSRKIHLGKGGESVSQRGAGSIKEATEGEE